MSLTQVSASAKANQSLTDRQKAIRQVIRQYAPSTQEKIVELLMSDYGIKASQATVSDEISKMNVGKNERGRYDLDLVTDQQQNAAVYLYNHVVDVIDAIDLFLVQTQPGFGRAVALTIEATFEDVLGTVSDERSVLVAVRSAEIKQRILQSIANYREAVTLKATAVNVALLGRSRQE